MNHKPISAQTRELLAKYDIPLKKSLGQNFLTDTHVLDKIIAAAHLTQNAGVLEIGPGMGALTERVAAKAKNVVAIEIDQRLIPVLRQLLTTQTNVEIIHGDVMKVDLHEMVRQHFQEVESIHVVANLPYYITSPILARLLEERLPFHSIVVMIQKEVADRFTAKPGTKDYSSFSVLIQYFAEVEVVTQVSRHVFIPRPKVDSTVIKLTLRERPLVDVVDEVLFFNIVRASFAQRRKTLLNTLQANLFSTHTKKEVASWLQHNAIHPNRRGETLHLQEFAAIANFISQVGDHGEA
jgi:16S rRNA (adenine1518-N6/adenine1519-N6)-dimethyltransferase